MVNLDQFERIAHRELARARLPLLLGRLAAMPSHVHAVRVLLLQTLEHGISRRRLQLELSGQRLGAQDQQRL